MFFLIRTSYNPKKWELQLTRRNLEVVKGTDDDNDDDGDDDHDDGFGCPGTSDAWF